MTINLKKGQKISLNETAGSRLTQIKVGLGWDIAKRKGFFGFGGIGDAVDLDAAGLMFDEQANLVDVAWFGQLSSQDGSVRHSGDNRTGAGDGDDEVISVDLSGVPVQVKSLIFTVNSFRGQTFETVKNAFCRVINIQDNQEIARFDLSCQGQHTALIVAKLYRQNGAWSMQAIGDNTNGLTFHDMMPQLVALV